MDSNAPKAWRVIDTSPPQAIYGTYSTHSEATKVAEELEPQPDENGLYRFVLVLVRN